MGKTPPQPPFAADGAATRLPDWLSQLGEKPVVRSAFDVDSGQFTTASSAPSGARAVFHRTAYGSAPDHELNQVRAHAELEGFAKGELEGRAAFDQATAALQEAANDLATLRRELLKGLERKMLLLSVAVAETILRRELASDPDFVARLVTEAMRVLEEASTVKVRVSPREHDTLVKQLGSLSAVQQFCQKLDVIADSHVEFGCIVETDASIVDATLQERLAAILVSFAAP